MIMKTKNFQEYLEKRLDKHEITEIEEQTLLEVKILQSIQKSIADSMTDYINIKSGVSKK